MKSKIYILNWVVALLITISCAAQVTPEQASISSPPKVIVLATGGTIAGVGDASTKAGYKAGEKPVEELLQAVPEIHQIAEIKGEQFANIGSQDMSVEIWLGLSKRINQIFEQEEADAVVVTHGTDTMEETAYFLSLTLLYDKPVILVGAMRPATALSADGNQNLLDAVIVAASPKSVNKGSMVVMNGQIFAARDVDKTHTISPAAFESRNYGPLGWIHDGKVEYKYQSLDKESKFDVRDYENLPQVDILYGYAGALAESVRFLMKFGARGIVYAGVGNGNFSQEVEKALVEVSENGVVVCRASRIGEGRVTLDNEVDDQKNGFVVADDLSPQKARILLMLALTKTNDFQEIQSVFFE